MTDLFLKMLNMGLTAGWLVLAVLLLRLLLRRAPGWVRYVLWALVGIRLVCPFAVQSVLSLIPGSTPIPADLPMAAEPAVQSGVDAVDQVINPILSAAFAPAPGDSVNPLQIWVSLAAIVWLAGVAALLLCALISFLRLRRKVAVSIPLEGRVYLCDHPAAPFILGLFRPRIYLPTGLSEGEIQDVLAHEQAHLARRDHWWKLLGFLLTAVYWVHPLIWLGYWLFCRDMELACDECVIRSMGEGEKRRYAETLVACSTGRSIQPFCPPTFGGPSIKARIRAVTRYKKPALWLIVAAIVASAAAAVCLLTDPVARAVSGPHAPQQAWCWWDDSMDLPGMASITLLPEDHTFWFSFSPLSSNCPHGTYRLTDDTLTLTTDDYENVYTFRRDSDQFIFDAARSTPLPSYSYEDGSKSQVAVPDGAVFKKEDSK